MKKNETRILKLAAAGALSALLWFPGTGRLEAQAPVSPARAEAQAAAPASPAGPAPPADHTITLTKMVDVYEFEDMRVAVDQYQVARGDGLLKLLRERGVLTKPGDEAKMLRLVRNLNPNLRNIDALEVGQVLNLPTLPAAAEEPAREAEGAAPSRTTETVKVYERPQSSQQPAKVVVRRQVPAESDQAQAPAPAETSGGGLDFPSGNAGPLAVDSNSGVVYRTVKIRPGDTLEKLLRREGMDGSLIYRHLLKVTQKLNPAIRNPNLILAGAELKIPAAGDYLSDLAGIDPQEVKTAAAAAARGATGTGNRTLTRRGQPAPSAAPVRTARAPGSSAPAAPSRPAPAAPERAAALELPAEDEESAKNTLGLIFTRLGSRVSARGHLSLPAGAGAVEVDTANFPLVETGDGGRVLLDIGSRLPQAPLKALEENHPEYKVFRTAQNESLDQALDRLWTLCSYYRVYKRDRTYEGGGDIRLKISADWIVWPTAASWSAGQPLVINRLTRADRRTDPAWINFLEAHGFKFLDLYRNVVLPAPAADPNPRRLEVADLDRRNPSLFAADLVRHLGVEPKVGLQLDMGAGAPEEGGAGLTAPVLWETGADRVVLDFGDMSTDTVQTLRQKGYRVVTAGSELDGVAEAVITGFGLKPQDALVLEAPAGGPRMSLAIKGRVVTREGIRYFITRTSLSPGLGPLVDPSLKILKY